jgi:hypothetical protein
MAQKWEPAEGTIVGIQPDLTRRPGISGAPQSAAYDIDVRMPDGSRQRAQVASGHHRDLQPGAIVRLERNATTGEVRLHHHASPLVIGFDSSAASAQDNSAASGGFAAATGMNRSFRVGGTDVDLTKFMGDSFTERISMVAGPEALDLVRTMMSGDPAARAAAREQFRQQALSNSQIHGQNPVHNPSDRLAKLQEMADRGQISQDEFAAKRQQILDEI